jgi:hypothetical protein
MTWKALTGLLLGASLLHGAAPFEGTIRFRMTDAKGRVSHMDYSLKGNKTRVDTDNPRMGHVAVIVDNATKKSVVLLDSQKVAMDSDIGETAPQGSPAAFHSTGRSMTIAGHACEEYASGNSHIWAAPGLGSYRHFQGGPMATRTRVPAWEKEMMEKGLFPLKMVDDGGVLEATKVEAKALPDSFFRAPDHYRHTRRP